MELEEGWGLVKGIDGIDVRLEPVQKPSHHGDGRGGLPHRAIVHPRVIICSKVTPTAVQEGVVFDRAPKVSTPIHVAPRGNFVPKTVASIERDV